MAPSSDVSIRFCFVEISEAIEHVYCNDRGCLFRGLLAPIFNTMQSLLWHKHRFNATFVFSSEFGVQTPDGNFTGCLGSMYRNESDASPAILDYPYPIDYETIQFVQVVLDSQVQMISGYNATTGIERVDIMDSSFEKQGIEFWIGLILLTFVSYVIMRIRYQIEIAKDRMCRQIGIRRYPLYDTLTYILSYDSTDFDDITRLTLTLFLTIGSFLLVTFFGNYMTTDLVVVKEPQVLRTYEDVIAQAHRIQPLFLEALTDYHEFMNAREGSIENKFWNTFNKKERFKAFNVDGSMLFPTKFGTQILRDIGAGARGERMILLADQFTQVIMSTICRLKAGFPLYQNVYPFASIDPRAAHRIKAILIRYDWMKAAKARGDPLQRNFEKNPIRVFEGGLIEALLRQIAKGFFTEHLDDIDYNKFSACMSYTELKMPVPDFTNMMPSNLKSLFLSCGLCLLGAFVVLLTERYYRVLVESIESV